MWSALLASLALVAAPQTPGVAAQDADRLADLIVDGRRIEEAARAFVEEIGAPPPGNRTGRWNSAICISVTGMQERYARYLIDRVAIAALDNGVEVRGPGCRPNVIILATDDGPGLASHLVEEVGLGFRPVGGGPTNLRRPALYHFRTSDAPIRWWHVTMPVEPSEGKVAVNFRGRDEPLGTERGVLDAPIIRVRDMSRMRSGIRYDIAWAIIIIDMSRTGGAPLGAVADYVALASLTQLDPFADMSGENTILNLFEEDHAVDSLTDWDRAYLTALYSSLTDRATERQQINDIVRRLTQVRGEAELDRLAEQGQSQDHPAPDGRLDFSQE